MRLWKRPLQWPAPRTLWLVKDDPKNEWHCACPRGVVNVPIHDAFLAPTGGSGWLFTCCHCGKAFMFAHAVRIRSTLDELATKNTPRFRRIMNGKTGEITEHVLLASPADWLAKARPLQEKITEGERYVFFDGQVLPAVRGPVRFSGVWRSHDLEDLPHLAGAPFGALLTDADYWRAERG